VSGSSYKFRAERKYLPSWYGMLLKFSRSFLFYCIKMFMSTHKNLPVDHILCPFNPINIVTNYFSKIQALYYSATPK